MRNLLLFCCGLALVACGQQPEPAEVAAEVSYRNEVVPIFQQSCAFSSCHSSAAKAGGLVLGPPVEVAAAASLAHLVNKPSQLDDSMMLVKPADPQASMLFRKLTGDFQGMACVATGCGTRMPAASAALDAARTERIRNWIAQGAQDN